mgnify:CR=1 FL=1
MSDIQWIFDVVDKASKPLKDIDKQLSMLPKDAKDTEDAIKKVEKALLMTKIQGTSSPLKKAELMLKYHQAELKKAADGTGKQTSHMKAAMSALGTGAGIAAATTVAAFAAIGAGALVLSKGLFELGLDASSSKRAMMGALEVFEGKDASKVFSVLQDMGIAAGISADGTVQAFQRLRTAGFEAKEAQDILAASFDVAAQMGGGERGLAAAEKFQDLMSKIGIMSKAGAKDLKAAVMGAGIPIAALQESVAARLKIPVDAAKTMLEAGKVGETTLQNSLLDVVQNKFDGGKGLGTKALDLAASSPVAQLQSLKDAFGNLFEDVDIAPFAGAIKGIVDQLKGPAGDTLKAMAESAFKMAGAFVGKVDMVGAITSIVSWIGKAVELAGSLADSFKKSFDPAVVRDIFAIFSNGTVSFADMKTVLGGVGTVLGLVANVAAQVARALLTIQSFTAPVLVWVFDKVVAALQVILPALSKVIEYFAKLPGFIKDGFAAGMAGGAGGDVGKTFGADIAEGTRSALEIRSPSRVMQRLGAYTAQGFQAGLDSATPSLSVATPELTGAGIAAGSAAGKSITITIGDIVVAGAAEAGREVQNQVRSALMSLLEEFGYT